MGSGATWIAVIFVVNGLRFSYAETYSADAQEGCTDTNVAFKSGLMFILGGINKDCTFSCDCFGLTCDFTGFELVMNEGRVKEVFQDLVSGTNLTLVYGTGVQATQYVASQPNLRSTTGELWGYKSIKLQPSCPKKYVLNGEAHRRLCQCQAPTTPSSSTEMCTTTTTDPFADWDNSSSEQEVFVDSGVMVSSDQIARMTLVSQAIPFLLQSKYQDQTAEVSMDFNETVQYCKYNGKRCDLERDFTTTYTPEYGHCFTFNLNKTKTSEIAGESFGLQLLLEASTDSYICSSTMLGFRFQIHAQDNYPFPDTLGIFVPTNFQTSMAITSQTFNMLDWPHGACNQDPYSPSDFYKGNYSVQGCLRSCIQSAIMTACNCSYPLYASPNDTDQCSLLDMPCVEKNIKCNDAMLETCICPSPCHNTIYKNTISSSRLIESPRMQQACALKNITNTTCLKKKGRSTAQVNVYFSKMSQTSYQEHPEYEMRTMLSHMGGSMGFLLGASIITAIEFICMPSIICDTSCYR